MKTKPAVIFLALLMVLSVLGGIAIWFSTPYGIGLVNDSAAYIGGAQNLLAGHGYTSTSGAGELKPITNFPPLFSLVLAGVGLTGISLLAAARDVIMLLFAIDIILVGLCVWRISGSFIFALLGAFLFCVSDVLLGVFSIAYSEPLFITLMLVVFLLLGEYFRRNTLSLAILAGIFTGLAYLARYSGITLLLSGVISIVLFHFEVPVRLRRLPWKALSCFLGGILAPFSVWTAYTWLSGHAIGNRMLVWHPISFQKLFEALKNLLTWVAPDILLTATPWFGRALSLLSLLSLPALLALAVWMIYRQNRYPAMPKSAGLGLALALILQILIYVAFLIVSISLFDATIPLDNRIFSPATVLGLVLSCAGLAFLWRALATQQLWKRWALGFFCLSLAMFSLSDGLHTMASLAQDGQGFAQSGWRTSGAIQYLRTHTVGIIYSDKPNAIYLLTGKSADIIPTPVDEVTLIPRANYASQVEELQAQVKAGKAILILFRINQSSKPKDQANYATLTRNIYLASDYGDSEIYTRQP